MVFVIRFIPQGDKDAMKTRSLSASTSLSRRERQESCVSSLPRPSSIFSSTSFTVVGGRGGGSEGEKEGGEGGREGGREEGGREEWMEGWRGMREGRREGEENYKRNTSPC